MKLFAAFAIGIVFTQTAPAQHQTFAVNPDASEVKMTLKTNHEIVNGIFHVQSGLIQFDRDAAKMSGTVLVAAGSGNTGNDARDRKMKSDILKVGQYNSVSFAPRSYTGTIAMSGDSNIQVSGVFTLLGAPHDITVPVLIHVDGAKAVAKAEFVVPYVQWGLKNPSFLIWKAGNDVVIDLSMVGQISN